MKLIRLLLDNRQYFIKNENNYNIYEVTSSNLPPENDDSLIKYESNFFFILNIISFCISYIFFGYLLKNLFHFIFG